MENNIIFICPSWEERSWLGFEHECNRLAISEAVVVKKACPINEQGISECINKIISFCQQKSIQYSELIWKEPPTYGWLSLNKELDNLVTCKDCIYMDITTMPRDIIWTLLFYFHNFQKNVKIRYYQPESYSNTWLSKEPHSPRLLLKHSGIIELGKPQCVVIVTGFDVERTRQIVSKFEPQKVILLTQIGQQFDNANRNQANQHEMICKSAGVSDVLSVDIDCYQYDFGKKTINDVITSLSNYNIVLASFGPKPSAIGVYMAYQRHPEVALCYVPCKEYNKDYCKGIGQVFSLDYK